MSHFDAANHYISAVTTGTPDSWTLTTVSGWLGLADYVGAGTRIVEYEAYTYTDSTIQTPSKIQCGRGTYTAATGILTQDFIRWSWNGTTHSKASGPTSSATEVKFTASSTTTRVYMTLSHSSALVGRMGYNSAGGLSADASLRTSLHQISTGGGLLFTANKESWFPYHWDGTADPSLLGIAIDTAAAGNVLLGVYECLATGLPGGQLAATAAISTNATGWQSASITQFSAPGGWYWLASVADNSSAKFRYISNVASNPYGTFSGNPLVGFTYNGSYASGLPASGRTSGISVSYAGLNNMPIMGML